jgi:hypothetical protein
MKFKFFGAGIITVLLLMIVSAGVYANPTDKKADEHSLIAKSPTPAVVEYKYYAPLDCELPSVEMPRLKPVSYHFIARSNPKKSTNILFDSANRFRLARSSLRCKISGCFF